MPEVREPAGAIPDDTAIDTTAIRDSAIRDSAIADTARPDGHSRPEAANPAAAIVLAAGEGRRMRSATPKVLHQIGGRALVGHAVHSAAGLAPEHLVVVAGHGRDQVQRYLDGLAVELSRSAMLAIQETQLGTGHAVACALDSLPRLSGPVVVTYGDVPLLDTGTLRGLLAEHAATGNAVTVLTFEPPDPTGYGRILRGVDPAGDDPIGSAARGGGGPVIGIVEHRDATAEQRGIREVNSGVYVFDAEVLADGLARLADGSAPGSQAPNAQGEQYLTDVVAYAHGLGRRVGALHCGDPWLVSGVNDRVQLAALRAEFNRRLLGGWMRDGVTVIDPATTWVDVGVQLDEDVVLHPGVQLHGATAVGRGAEVGPDTTLTDCRIGPRARVVRTHGSAADIGEGASVGPFAYLRPGARLGAAGKIGTFVEVKNAEIGAGSKVPHLTYVGDATIGAHSNIGASSVFVNYDGVTKHRTVVGSHVKTGSDNTFVAPVTIGDGAYTGAGAVIRQDVPAGALAVSAGDQRVIPGWVARRRPGTEPARAAERAGPAVNGDREMAPDPVRSAEPGDTVGTSAVPPGGNQRG